MYLLTIHPPSFDYIEPYTPVPIRVTTRRQKNFKKIEGVVTIVYYKKYKKKLKRKVCGTEFRI